jgi:hypothetical protein
MTKKKSLLNKVVIGDEPDCDIPVVKVSDVIEKHCDREVLHSVTIYRKLRSIRSDKKFNVTSTRIRNMAIRREAEQCYVEMITKGLSSWLPGLAQQVRDGHGTIKISVHYGSVIQMDDDNAITSVNKLLIDPLVRCQYFKSDKPDKIKQTIPTWTQVQKGSEFITLTMSIEGQ